MKAIESNSPKVSVIVPVWNPGPGILRCTETLRSQTLKDIEIIFVDDCGTDDSMEIVRRAASKDSRIRIICNEKNMGPGASRNKGIEEASGEYLSFIDPDDYIEKDFLEKLYKKAKSGHHDIVKGRIAYELYNGNTIERPLRNRETGAKIEEGISLFNAFCSGHFSAIYSKQLINASHARYGENFNYEEGIFLLCVCHASNNATFEDTAVYHYVQRANSLTNQWDVNRLKDQVTGLKDRIRYLIEQIDDTEQSALYAAGGVEYNLQVQLEAGRAGVDTAWFLKDIREEILQLPFLGRMKELSLPVKILTEDGVGLAFGPVSRLKGDGYADAYADLAKDWVDYAYTHQNRIPLIRRGLYSVFHNAKRAIKEEQMCATERNNLKQKLLEQMRRLPYKERCRMVCTTNTYALAQHLPEDIKSKLKRLLLHS